VYINMATPTVPPNQSLYVQNLPEKLQKHDLRRALYMLFSPYGAILDIVALKTRAMRGQAHVLFKDIPSASQAMRACQDFEFYGRKIRISYSKNRSNTLAKLTGTFGQPAPSAPQVQKGQGQQGGASTLPPPPGTGALPPPPGIGSLPPPPGLPQKVQPPGGPPPAQPPSGPPPAQAGTKRARDESEDEAPMEEDDDEGEMEMSDED
jgi:U2 small nuclear ribonucleoprotein B''